MSYIEVVFGKGNYYQGGLWLQYTEWLYREFRWTPFSSSDRINGGRIEGFVEAARSPRGFAHMDHLGTRLSYSCPVESLSSYELDTAMYVLIRVTVKNRLKADQLLYECEASPHLLQIQKLGRAIAELRRLQVDWKDPRLTKLLWLRHRLRQYQLLRQRTVNEAEMERLKPRMQAVIDAVKAMDEALQEVNLLPEPP